jgi:hypothetical protein
VSPVDRDPGEAGDPREAGETGRSGETGTGPAQPLLRVVRGDATEEELAALLAVLAAAAGGAGAGADRPLSAWTDRSAAARAPLAPGPGAWRASAWPRG